jgi:small-conductance mechanosensitive channel
MPNINSLISPEMARTLLSISLTLLIAIIVDNILRSFIKVPKSMDSRRAHTYTTILRRIITIIVYVVALHLIFTELGINLTPLLASAGIIGIVVGVGARTLVEDLINGFFLLTQDSIAIGDYVKLDIAEGYIEKIGLRTLTIRGDSGALFIIPNGQVKMVINYSHHRSYMSIEFPVKADQDIDMTIHAMQEALKELHKDKEIQDSIFPDSIVNGLEDFKVDGRMILRTTIITRPAMRLIVARKYRYLTKKNFEKYKIGLS